MDAVVFIILALILVLKPEPHHTTVEGQVEANVEDVTREAKLNPSFYNDENAFSEMINELGFPKGAS